MSDQVYWIQFANQTGELRISMRVTELTVEQVHAFDRLGLTVVKTFVESGDKETTIQTQEME